MPVISSGQTIFLSYLSQKTRKFIS